MKKFLKFVVYAFVALIALFVVLAIVSDDKPNQAANQEQTAVEQTGEPSAKEEKTAEEIEQAAVVSAKQLFAAYKDNEMAADNQYKDKLLEVSGKVVKIDSDFANNAVVGLQGGQYDFETTDARGDGAFNEYAMTLKKGQTITIVCRGNGEVIGMPSLKDCQPKQ